MKIHPEPQSGNENVARRETSGNGRKNVRALKERQTEVIFATGIHRPVSDAEKAELLSPFIAQRVAPSITMPMIHETSAPAYGSPRPRRSKHNGHTSSGGGSTHAAWAVSAFDLTGYQNQKQYVELSLDKSRVSVGETANLTITVRQRGARRLCVVGIVSTLGVYSYMWPLAVVMQ